MPTEQLSLQSNYFKKVDLSGRVSYTGGDMNVDGYQELFDRTREPHQPEK